MVKKLRVTIGPHRQDVEIASVNDASRPVEIDTNMFVGRVLVRVRDFNGITPDGGPPHKDDPYFVNRSRKFSIQIEGRFKHRDGVEPYNADEIQFGSDFDHLVDFPRTAFNAGMKVATWVDPATFYEEKPASARPYIMSPYAACMNTVAAWPAPSRAQDAVVILRHTELENGGRKHHEDDSVDGSEDLVPIERLGKGSRHLVKYWRFLGFKTDARLQPFLTAHAPHILAEPSSSDARPGMTHSASLGVIPRTGSPDSEGGASTPTTSHGPSFAADSPVPSRTSTPKPEKKSSGSAFKLGGMMKALGGQTNKEAEIKPEDVTTADHLRVPDAPKKEGISTRLDDQLGPWRFADEGVDPVEDNSFVYIDKSISTAKRRKFFVDAKNRKQWTYDPDVVYSTSFFTSFADLNTFDLSIGPVNMSLVPYFHDMPIRYTLRSTRQVEYDGKLEEEVFATIAFELVDVDA